MSRAIARVSIAAVAIAAFSFAAPASAAIFTFATTSATSADTNIRFANLGNNAGRIADALVYSTTTKNATTKGAVTVRFSILLPELAAYITDVDAAFTLDGTIAKNTPATLTTTSGGTFFVQHGFTGTMTFLSKTAISVGAPNFTPQTFAVGSNLLTATFTNGSLSGKIGDTAGSSNQSTVGSSTLTFTSDFLDFSQTAVRDASLALTATSPLFAVGTGANQALRGFRSNLGGQFSSDPPMIPGLIVPEPEIWGMLVVGFGLVGMQVRRRKPTVVAA